VLAQWNCQSPSNDGLAISPILSIAVPLGQHGEGHLQGVFPDVLCMFGGHH